MNADGNFVKLAIELARDNVIKHKGRPFGAVLVRNDEILATGINEFVQTGDPTSHAELEAIRSATIALKTPRLDGATMYASGQPCPMCMSAMYLTGVNRVCFGYAAEDGEPFGFSGARIFAELAKPIHQQSIKCVHVPEERNGESLYELWRRVTQ